MEKNLYVPYYTYVRMEEYRKKRKPGMDEKQRR